MRYSTPPGAYDTFMAALDKDPADLTPAEIRAFVACAGMLDKDGRHKFRHVLVRETLTTEETERYASLQLLDRLFPPADSVGE